MERFPYSITGPKDEPLEVEGEITVDESGRLILPPGLSAAMGLNPGVRAPAVLVNGELRLRRPLTSLAKVYVEPTSACNLVCRTCMRNTWDEAMGSLSMETFERILDGLRAFDPLPEVFFGGFGEPLAHPAIGEMVAQAKALGARVELITNGTLLNDRRSRELVSARLDRLWVSLDGATPEGYSDVRLAEAFPQVISNLVHYQEVSRELAGSIADLGVSFVAMKRNIHELPSLIQLRTQIGASRYLVTNVLPYAHEHRAEMLYNLAISKIPEQESTFSPLIELPRIDLDEVTSQSLLSVMRIYNNVTFEGERLNHTANVCPFIERGSISIAWDGELSPCLGLLHNYKSYFNDLERRSRRYTIGNIGERSLKELWEDPAYLDFRRRVREFPYAPCTKCGGCELVKSNLKDCYGNGFPTCGACLWAQGVIRCP
ncbi:MAG TPA: radical SAM protein [Anaerolineaceae bacterium]|nr:radical SAM protein [Anaerolineaceae bacterium]